MSAQLIFDLVPLGAIVRFFDGTPRPPERHRKKLAAWEYRNSGGRLIRKQPERRVGNTVICASITLGLWRRRCRGASRPPLVLGRQRP
jgi:hypothetical protein